MTPQRNVQSTGSEERLAAALGWFSIGLGLGELVSPGAMARLIGVKDERGNRKVLRVFGMRELAAGFGILSQKRPAGWVWGRVAGDLLDFASLSIAMISSENRLRLLASMGAAAGVTGLDIYCADRLNRLPESINREKQDERPSAAVITIGRSPDEVQAAWQNFQHIRAQSGAGKKLASQIEFSDYPSEHRIEFRSTPDTIAAVSGKIRFDPAPANRGTVVRAELDPMAGNAAVRAAGKLLGLAGSEWMQNELRMLKQFVETGEIATSDASIHPGMHAAQPPSREEELVHA